MPLRCRRTKEVYDDLERLQRSKALALNVTSRIEGTFAILDLTGTLTLGPTLSSLRDAAKTALANKNVSGLILHVGGITIVDSSGLGELTVVYTLATNRNCRLRLVEVPASLKRMLEMTRIDELLPSSPSIAAAKS